MQSKWLIATGLSIAALGASAATPNQISDWDSDGNGSISQSEWGNQCTQSDLFDNWDTDNDGLIDDDEYATGLFRHWDENDNGVLEESEWRKANDNWFGEYDAEFSAWDSDGDGFLEYREFDTGLGKTAYYSDWDANNTLFIEREEFCSSLFAQADANDDDRIEVGDFDDETAVWYVY